MPTDPRLDDLLDVWDERRLCGEGVSPEALCVACPELEGELRRLIDGILAGERALDAAAERTTALPGPVLPGLADVPHACLGTGACNCEILDERGRGAMGVVYRARELGSGRLVALKVMQQADASTLRRFQREFRALQKVSHPNLVTLYRAGQEGGQWFFTMELVEGDDFLTHVRGDAQGGLTAERLQRLRSALRQLGAGVQAAHERDVLHRDLKPSNVLVTATGQVKVLDFGLAADLGPDGRHHSTAAGVCGTFAYMSPEQGDGEQVTAASDWYSVGVMLYQALAGRLPFQGSPWQMQHQRRSSDPLAPHAGAAPVRTGSDPDDLDRLCLDLLRRRPEERPGGPEILARLGVPHQPPSPPCTFLGRQAQLASLGQALGAVREQRRAMVVVVQGVSGAGKTALVEHFLAGAHARGEALVLAGRCYERESVPYKALDSLIEALTHHLGELGPRAEALLPLDVGPLLRVFPVLGHVPAVAAAPRLPLEALDPQDLRRRAFAGLRELLARLGLRQPLVLAIDDLQWGDVDSALLLADLLAPPAPPRLLLLACFRSEDAGRSAFLQEFARVREKSQGAIDWLDLSVAALTSAEARALALRLVGAADVAAEARAGALADESGGNPFFLYRLAQHSLQRGGPVGLDALLRAQVAGLPDDQRRLLEAVAVSGRPLGLVEACRAAELDTGGWDVVLALQAERLLRGTGAGGSWEVEVYHDRIREVVVELPPEALRGLHRRLAQALQEGGSADPEALAGHFERAGMDAEAGVHYAAAADQAARALAFDRAARLYERAVGLLPPPVSSTGRDAEALHGKRGDALAHAGRGGDAAEAYLAAAAQAGDEAGLEWRRRAFEQFLRSGHIERGRQELRTVLAAVGMKLPETPGEGLLLLLSTRERLWLRGGHRYRERPASQVPAAALTRLDVCWSAYLGFSMVDHMLASAFHARHLLLALRAGEPYQLVLALAAEASQAAIQGRQASRRVEALLRKALALVERLPEEERNRARAQVLLRWGSAAVLLGHWREARDRCREAERLFRATARGVAWEVGTAGYLTLLAQSRLGEWQDMACRLPELLREARERDDRYTSNLLLTQSALVHLAADDPDQAREALRHAREVWPGVRFDLQRYWNDIRQIEVALYRADPTEAHHLFARYWADLKQSLLLRWQGARIFAYDVRGRCMLLRAANSPGRAANLLRVAEGAAVRLQRERTHHGNALAGLLHAGVAALRGDQGQAVRHLETAEEDATAADMALHAVAARRRRGRILGGDPGRALVESADEWLPGQGIRNPERLTALLAPGFPEER